MGKRRRAGAGELRAGETRARKVEVGDTEAKITRCRLVVRLSITSISWRSSGHYPYRPPQNCPLLGATQSLPALSMFWSGYQPVMVCDQAGVLMDAYNDRPLNSFLCDRSMNHAHHPHIPTHTLRKSRRSKHGNVGNSID